MPMEVYIPTLSGTRAKRLLEQAADEIDSGIDALITVSAAVACLKIDAGELPESEMDGYEFPGEDQDDDEAPF